MSAKKRRQDSLKAKEKKQKIIAGVGGVLLLGLLAFQVPRVMKMMHGSAAAAPPPPVTTSSPTSTSPASTPATPTTLGGADATASLASFSRFQSKDPFRQQVTPASSADSAPAATPAPAAATTTSGSPAGTTGSSSSAPSAPAPSASAGGGVGTQPAPGGAVIAVNGKLMSVAVGSDFPAATPLFHLLSVTPTTAKISIAGGRYSSGAASVTLRVNKPVTLMNTADGTRYKLILKPQGTPAPADGAVATTTTTIPTGTTPSP